MNAYWGVNPLDSLAKTRTRITYVYHGISSLRCLVGSDFEHDLLKQRKGRDLRYRFHDEDRDFTGFPALDEV